MKIKPGSKKGRVVVEMESQGAGWIPPLPFQLQRILVPVDFSEMAGKALRYAVHLAIPFDAEVVLLHVLQPYIVSPDPGYLPPELAVSQRELQELARQQLEKLLVKLRIDEVGARLRWQVRVRLGVAWQEIIAEAVDLQTDLIILSTHGRTGLSHALMGSVAERVVRHAPCPVLVVRERERDFVPLPRLNRPK